MKNLMFILLFCSVVHSQDFMMVGGDVVLEKIIHEKADVDKFISNMRRSGNFTEINRDGNSIYAYMPPKKINTKLAEGGGSLYMFTDNVSAYTVVDFKDDRYRITVKKIIFVANVDTGFGATGQETPLERYALNRSGFRKAFLKRDSEILKANLLENFDFNKRDDW